MSGEPFTLDTNILVHSLDLGDRPRHETARLIVTQAARLPCILALQAVSEFYVVVTRERLMPSAAAVDVATAMLDLFRMAAAVDVATAMLDLFRTAAASATAIRRALAASAAGQASYWDALLIATAAGAGCTTILTEDMADGSALFGVRILNPFAAAGLTPAAADLLGVA